MHVGDVRESQLVIGNYNTVQTPKGAKVTVIQAGTVPAPTLRAMPVRFRAAARVEAVGRDEELALAGSASPESPVELYGGDGIGKTTVLKLVAEDPSPPSEGVAFESIRRRSLDEVQAKLYSVFWECEVPFLPGPAEIGEYLADRDALLLLDDCELDRDDLEALLDCAPRSTFVIGSETRNLWSQGTARRLTGLKPAAGVALLERDSVVRSSRVSARTPRRWSSGSRGGHSRWWRPQPWSSMGGLRLPSSPATRRPWPGGSTPRR